MRLFLLLFIAAAGVGIAQDEDRAVGVPQDEAGSAAASAPKNVDAAQDDAQPPPPPADPAPQPIVRESVKPSGTPATQEGSDDHMQHADLEAQESMARAAWAMFWSAALQILIGTIGLILIYLTLKASRDAVSEAEKATQAAQEAARHSADGVSVTRQVADSQLRPWLSVSCKSADGFRPSKPGNPDYIGYWLDTVFEVQNHGPSPASLVSIHAEIGGFLNDDDQHGVMTAFCDRFATDPAKRGQAVFPSEKLNLNNPLFLSQETIDTKTADIADIKSLMTMIYGCVCYTSPHVSGVCQTRFMFPLCQLRGDSPASFRPNEPNWFAEGVVVPRFVLIETT